MRTVASITTGLLLIAFAGCGATPSSAGDFEGEQRAVAEAVEELQTAGQQQEPDRICTDLITMALREKIEAPGLQCDAEMRKAIEDADAFEFTVEKVDIQGSRATVVVAGDIGGGDEARRTLRMVKERNVWRADSLGGG